MRLKYNKQTLNKKCYIELISKQAGINVVVRTKFSKNKNKNKVWS